MDDPSGLGWWGWVIVGTVIGVGIGWERVATPAASERVTIGLKLLLAIWWAAMVAIEAETLRGFLVMFLSSVGAYKLGSLVAEYLTLRLGLGRR
jgi:hypothetical protein